MSINKVVKLSDHHWVQFDWSWIGLVGGEEGKEYEEEANSADEGVEVPDYKAAGRDSYVTFARSCDKHMEKWNKEHTDDESPDMEHTCATWKEAFENAMREGLKMRKTGEYRTKNKRPKWFGEKTASVCVN